MNFKVLRKLGKQFEDRGFVMHNLTFTLDLNHTIPALVFCRETPP